MKRVVVGLCAILAACQQSGGSENNAADQAAEGTAEDFATAAEDAEPIGTMLKEGKVEACAHPVVKAHFLNEIESAAGQVTPFERVTQADIDEATAAMGEPDMSDFQALEADQSVGALACGMTLSFNGGGSWPIQYILRPSLEDETGFLIAYPPGSARPGAMYRSLLESRADGVAIARRAEEPKPEPEVEENVSLEENVSAM